MKRICLPLAGLFLFACTTPHLSTRQDAATQTSKIIRKDEKCFQKCLIPDQFATEKVVYPIYQGSDPAVPLETVEWMTQPGGSVWVKKGQQMCLVEKPPVYQKVIFLKDTIRFRDFTNQTFETRKLVKTGGFMRETEIVCPDQQDANLAMKISLALRESGYTEKISTTFDADLNSAIEKYQRNYGLPVGAISIELLQHLDKK